MKMNKAFRYQIYPTKEQEILINKTFGCCRFIYNIMLQDKISYYQEHKQMLYNSPAQYKDEFTWLREVDSQALSYEKMHLDTAFRNFFRNKGKTGFPKYKSKKKDKLSYTTAYTYMKNNVLSLGKLGVIKYDEHRYIPENYVIKSGTISKTGSGKYFISILTEYEYEPPVKELDKTKSIGLDYSSPKFYIDSNSEEAGYPKFYREYEEKLAKEQRKLSHMKYESNNYFKQLKKVNLIHEKISNCRKDFCHKKSYELAEKYDIVCIEDINLQDLSQCLTLGKSTNDNGFSMFRIFLEYKLFERGKKLVKIDKWYPSSKTCNECGYVNKDLKLSDRTWICPECGAVIERDYNASLNILNEGLRILNL